MPGKEEKARRREIAHAMREQKRGKVRASLPPPVSELKKLFDFLDERISNAECDETLRLTREFIRQNAMDETRIVSWLEESGGYCDCEVLANVEDVVADAFPGFKADSG